MLQGWIVTNTYLFCLAEGTGGVCTAVQACKVLRKEGWLRCYLLHRDIRHLGPQVLLRTHVCWE